MAAPAEIKPAYLIRGTDAAKIDATLGRLRARAEREAGAGALESFAPEPGVPPDSQALVAALPAMSLMGGRRYLLADCVERWSAKQAEPLIEALAALPPETTLVLAARVEPTAASRDRARVKKVLDQLAAAVEAAGGEVRDYDAPRTRDLPAHLCGEARRRGFELEPDAARLLVDRMGESTQRLAGELDRLALWAGQGETVGVAELEEMVADTSEEVAWALSDALVDRNGAAAMAAAERLGAQGESVTPLVYQAAKRLREARAAIAGLESGQSAKQLEASLPMHPYAARMLLRRVRNASAEELRSATCAIADLEWWTRGGSDYPADVALALAVRRAAGVREAC